MVCLVGGVGLTGASVSPSCPPFLAPPMPHRGLSPLVDSGHLWAKQPCVSGSRTADCQSHPPTERFLLRSPTSVTCRRQGARAGTHLPNRWSVVSHQELGTGHTGVFRPQEFDKHGKLGLFSFSRREGCEQYSSTVLHTRDGRGGRKPSVLSRRQPAWSTPPRPPPALHSSSCLLPGTVLKRGNHRLCPDRHPVSETLTAPFYRWVKKLREVMPCTLSHTVRKWQRGGLGPGFWVSRNPPSRKARVRHAHGPYTCESKPRCLSHTGEGFELR